MIEENSQLIASIFFDTHFNKINLYFPNKPDDNIRKILEQNGWNFNKKKKIFYPDTLEAGIKSKDFLTHFTADLNINTNDFSSIGLPDYAKKLTQEEIENIQQNIQNKSNLFTEVSDIIKSGVALKKINPNENIKEIEFRRGEFKHNGVLHIASRRYDERTQENKGFPKENNVSTISTKEIENSLKEVTALLFLVTDALNSYEATYADGRNWYIHGNGLEITIRKDKYEHFVVTGYTNDMFSDKKNEEATEAISAVIAKYGYTQEFLDLYTLVGAELASLYPNIAVQIPSVNSYFRKINKYIPEINIQSKVNENSIPQNIQTISDSLMSFEQNKADVLDIIGKQFEIDATGKSTLNGMKSLSTAMEIYSDKHYETARYLFVKDGTVIRHLTVSSQTPSSTIIKPDDKFLFSLKSYAKETDSQIVFLHNHPSGYVEPSDADIELTEYLNNFFTEVNGTSYFSGHIILDHGNYGLYDSKERKWNALINDKLLPLSEISKNYQIQLTKYGTKINFNGDKTISEDSAKKLSELAKKCDAGNVWNTKYWIPAVMLTGNGIVTSVEYINISEFNEKSVLSEKLKSIGREYGSENVVLLPHYREQFLMCERFAQETGKIKDIVFENADGTFDLSHFSNGNIFNDLRKDEIRIEDTELEIEKVKEKIIYEQSVNKSINDLDKENKTMKNLTETETKVSLYVPKHNWSENHNRKIRKEDDSYTQEDKENAIKNEENLSLFDKELQEFIDGNLPKSHIFSLGKPSEILVKCGFPAEQRIELSASHLEFKSKLDWHPFDMKDILGLEEALRNPIAVFEYGDRNKSQNVIINIEKDGKNFLAGVHFNQEHNGFEISTIRILFPKDTVEWLNWMNQGKLIYGDKEKLQALIAQQRINVADVNSQVVQSPLHEHCLESCSSILDMFGEVKDIFADEYPFYEDVKKKAAIEQKFFNYYVTKGNLDARELSVFESEEFYNALISGDKEKIEEYTKTDLHEINELASEIYDSYSKENSIEEEQEITQKNNKNSSVKKQKLEEPFDLAPSEKEEIIQTQQSQKEVELLAQIENLQKKNQYLENLHGDSTKKIAELEKKLEAITSKVFASKEHSANDSLSTSSNYSSNSSATSEEPHQNYVNKDGFGIETAYKTNTQVPVFGIYDDDTGEMKIIENAKFSRFEEDKYNPGYGTVVLEIFNKDGTHNEFRMTEKAYNEIINNVQKLEERKHGIDPNSFEWKKAHMDYAQKMKIDENMYRLNTPANFRHNFEIQCRHDNAHNPEQALKIASIMYKNMAPRDKEQHLRDRKEFDKKHGKGSYDKMLIALFNKNHPKADIGINGVVSNTFDEDKAEQEMNPIYETLRNGEQIENTKTHVGDNISLAMTIKTPEGKTVKLEKNDWKIKAIQKGLHKSQAFLYDEQTKAYQTVPLDMLVNHIRKVEKIQEKDEKKQIKKDQRDVGFGR